MWGRISSTETYAEIYDKLDDHSERFGHAFLEGTVTAEKTTWPRLGEAYRKRAKLLKQLGELFSKYDLLLTPTLAFEAIDARGHWPEEVDGKPLANPLHVVPFTPPFKHLGTPGDHGAHGLQR
jgi:Asp-tRNA(Asn)/Glu-tRNA(Gln) amidotransferase A subunit family amidase